MRSPFLIFYKKYVIINYKVKKGYGNYEKDFCILYAY